MQAGSVPVRRRGRIVPAAVALLVGSWLLAAAPAAAHALVVGSNPQAGARIARAPAELRVAFSEAVRPLGPGLTLQGPSGGQVRLGPVRHPDGRPEVLAATLPTLGDGSYLAGWRIVSADDGHLEAGSFAFAVGTGSGPVTSPAPSQLPTPWQVAGRWLETAGVLGLVGVVVAALAIWHRPEPIGPDEPRWWAVTVAAAAVGAVGLAWQVAAGAATADGPGPGAVGAFLSASPATGRRLLVELVLLGAMAALVWWRVRRGRRPGLGALALAVGAVVTLALGAHDTGLAPRWLFLPLEVVHLLAVGVWIGGLAVLALTARRAKLEAVRRFSVLALRAVLVVAVTGIWQGLAQVSSRAALTGTDYGRVLAVKATAFLVVLGLAAVARFRLLPRASADAVAGETPGGLRRLLAIEATGGAVVVLVAALLANTVPAGEVLAAASAARVRGGVQAQQLEAGPLRLQVGLEPGTVGRNLLQVQVTDPSGRLVDGLARIDLTIADQAGRAAPASVRATRVAPATYRAATDAFALPGGWRVGVAVPGAAPGLAARFAIAAAPPPAAPHHPTRPTPSCSAAAPATRWPRWSSPAGTAAPRPSSPPLPAGHWRWRRCCPTRARPASPCRGRLPARRLGGCAPPTGRWPPPGRSVSTRSSTAGSAPSTAPTTSWPRPTGSAPIPQARPAAATSSGSPTTAGSETAPARGSTSTPLAWRSASRPATGATRRATSSIWARPPGTAPPSTCSPSSTPTAPTIACGSTTPTASCTSAWTPLATSWTATTPTTTPRQ